MQKITISGRLGRDAAIRETRDGSKVISFTVAVNSRYRNVEKTSWYDVSAFNYERYKNMTQYLTKGSGVFVTGDLDADIEVGKDGVTRCRRSILADSIEFNSNGTSGGTENNATKTTDKSATEAPDTSADPEDVDMTIKTGGKKGTTKPAPAPEPEDKDDLPF